MFRGRSNALAFLGLPPGASDAEAKKAYRKMALRMHPNQGGSTANFQKLGAAIDMVRGAVRFQPENGPAQPPPQPQARPRPGPEDPRPQRPTVRVMVTGVPGPLENTTRDLVFLPGQQAPTLGTVLDRIPQEIPAFAEYLKNGLRAHRATMYLNGAVVKESITEHSGRAPLLGSGLSSTVVFLLLEARKPGQTKSGWMFLGESANAFRRRTAAEADERKKKRNAKRNADAAKARASAGVNANNGPAEYKVYVWNVRNMDGSGPARTPIAIKQMTFGVKPTVLQVIERIAGGSDMIRRMAEKGYLAFDKPRELRPSNFKRDPIKDVRKTLAPKFFHLIVRELHDKNTYDMKWKKLAFDADAEARARARERFGGAGAGPNRAKANADAAKAKANAEAAKARANADAAKARANAEAARARANAEAARARANAEAKARANAEAAKARANAEAAKAKANADAKAAKARANADAEAARARANAAKAEARARAENRARDRAANEANARERADANAIEVDFWDGVSVRPSGARFEFPAGTRPTIGMLLQRFAAEPEIRESLKDGFRVIRFSKAWHPKYKGKGFDALLGPENNAAANASRRVIVLARQPKQRKEGWMYLPGTTPKPTKKKANAGFR